MKSVLSLLVILTVIAGIKAASAPAASAARTPAPNAAGPKIRSLNILPDGQSAIKGAAVQFTASATFADGASRDVTGQATWSSSNSRIVTVDPSGLARVLAGKGTATITAAYGGRSASSTITAYASRLRAITISPHRALLSADATLQFAAAGTFSDGSTRDLTSLVSWRSSNKLVATVTSSGIASAIASRGTVSVTASYGETTGSARLVVAPKLLHEGAEYCVFCHPAGASAPAGPGKKVNPIIEAVPALCYQCHPPFAADRSFHAPVKEGLCTGCHDPHRKESPHLLTQPVRDLCFACHPDVTERLYVHGPTASGACTVCHDPHGSVNERLLVNAGAELCLTCHFDIRTELRKRLVHPAISAGCTSCHDPHGAPNRGLLSSEGAPLCFTCHPAIESKISASAQSVHQPIRTGRGCASCHAPHASDGPKLLPKAGKDLCLGCHKDLIRKTDTVLHGPIKDGTCLVCHDPHGSPNEKLLVKPYSSAFYVSYNNKEFPLCFSCHSRSLVSSPVTSSATGFRDGNRNLHYLHVNRKDLGKRCKACHVVHGGPKPALIADKVPFGTWQLPLNFARTDTGGSCAPGCHKAVVYTNRQVADKGSTTPGKTDQIKKNR